MALAVVLGLPATTHAQTGTVSGRITNAVTGTPLTSGSVEVCNTNLCTTAAITSTGVYTATVTTGTYFVFTRATGFANQVSGGVACPFECDFFNAFRVATTFAVTAGTTVTRDFALSPEGVATGVVVDGVTGLPVSGVQVTLATLFGGRDEASQATTNAAGVFTIRGLSTGTYFAFADEAGAKRYVPEIFGDIPCLISCSASNAIDIGAAIAATAGAVTGGIDFTLERGGAIAGTVRRKGTPTPLANVTVVADLRMGSQWLRTTTAVTSALGAYVLTGLPAGSYNVHTEAFSAVNEVYDTVRCTNVCTLQDIGAGRPVAVPARNAVTGIDFGLSSGATVSGVITRAGSGTPVAATASAYLVGTLGVQFAGSGSTNGAGAYSITGLATGTYVVLVQASGFSSELFGGVQIIDATDGELRRGTRLTVSDGVTTPNVNVALDAAGSIRGRVRLAGTLTPAADVHVVLFRGGATPIAVTSAYTDSSGNFAMVGVPAGTYFVATDAQRLDNQAFAAVACPGGVCTASFVAANAFSIVVTTGLTVNNIDFTLGPATGPPGEPFALDAVNVPGGVRVSWQAPVTGGTPASYRLEAGLDPGTTFASAPVTGTSITIPGIPPGVYFLRVRGVNAAGAGAASEEITLRVGANGVAAPEPPENVTPLVIDGRLTLTWQVPNGGPVPTGYQLEVGTSAGRSDIGVLPMPGRIFRVNGVPPGVYFVRVRALAGSVIGPPSRDVLLVVGNVPAPPGDPFLRDPVVAGQVLTLSWVAPFFGPVTDYIVEAGTRPGVADIGSARIGSAATSLTIPGVPPGRYFLRVRAVNAQGSGAPSNDQEVVVP